MRLEVVGRLKIFSSVMGNWFIFISTLKQHEVYSTFSQIDSISAASCQVYGRVQVHMYIVRHTYSKMRIKRLLTSIKIHNSLAQFVPCQDQYYVVHSRDKVIHLDKLFPRIHNVVIRGMHM